MLNLLAGFGEVLQAGRAVIGQQQYPAHRGRRTLATVGASVTCR